MVENSFLDSGFCETTVFSVVSSHRFFSAFKDGSCAVFVDDFAMVKGEEVMEF
jgi:hypothetical protein